tara:strand:- start:5181 stop:5939 length:759 start_codon:yes stop_codon:yes gene_type:complete
MDFKKILVAGCSWSSGYGHKDYKGYGEELSDLLNCDVDNIADAGIDNYYSIYQIYNYLLDNSPDLIILQLTSLDRSSIPIDGYENFLYTDIRTVTKQGKIFRLNPGSYLNMDYYLEDFYKVTNIDKIPDLKNFLKLFFERVTFSNYFLANTMYSIAGLQSFVKQKGIKILIYPYQQYGWRTITNDKGEKTSAQNIHSFEFIDKSSYINLSFEEFVGGTEEQKKLSIDKGFHLSKKGHRILAEKFLLPYIEKL